jgi:hypothetical protein
VENDFVFGNQVAGSDLVPPAYSDGDLEEVLRTTPSCLKVTSMPLSTGR